MLCFLSLSTKADVNTREPLDYTELDYNVRYGTEVNQVTVDIPSSYYYYNVYVAGVQTHQIGGDSFVFSCKAGQDVSLYVYPTGYKGLLLDTIPVGSKLVFDFVVHLYGDTNYYVPTFQQCYVYADSDSNWLSGLKKEKEVTGSFGSSFTLEYTIADVDNAYAFIPALFGSDWGTVADSAQYTVELSNVSLVMDVPVAYWEQWQAEQNGQLLGDIKTEIGNVNDKLDDTNEKLEELPGEIGDEMQGVIDKENEKAESSGNKFVNQILDKLPDPSTDVLASLKKLTDAVGYEGDEAVIPFPKIVVPGVDGLFEDVLIYDGSDFDLGETISLIPEKLLNLVRHLFTIAVVLYCVYELKGIISYCFTLKESKGG